MSCCPTPIATIDLRTGQRCRLPIRLSTGQPPVPVDLTDRLVRVVATNLQGEIKLDEALPYVWPDEPGLVYLPIDLTAETVSRAGDEWAGQIWVIFPGPTGDRIPWGDVIFRIVPGIPTTEDGDEP